MEISFKSQKELDEFCKNYVVGKELAELSELANRIREQQRELELESKRVEKSRKQAADALSKARAIAAPLVEAKAEIEAQKQRNEAQEKRHAVQVKQDKLKLEALEKDNRESSRLLRDLRLEVQAVVFQITQTRSALGLPVLDVRDGFTQIFTVFLKDLSSKNGSHTPE